MLEWLVRSALQGCDTKRSWDNWDCYPGFSLQVLMTTMKTSVRVKRSPVWHFNASPPENTTVLTVAWQTCKLRRGLTDGIRLRLLTLLLTVALHAVIRCSHTCVSLRWLYYNVIGTAFLHTRFIALLFNGWYGTTESIRSSLNSSRSLCTSSQDSRSIGCEHK